MKWNASRIDRCWLCKGKACFRVSFFSGLGEATAAEHGVWSTLGYGKGIGSKRSDAHVQFRLVFFFQFEHYLLLALLGNLSAQLYAQLFVSSQKTFFFKNSIIGKGIVISYRL